MFFFFYQLVNNLFQSSDATFIWGIYFWQKSQKCFRSCSILLFWHLNDNNTEKWHWLSKWQIPKAKLRLLILVVTSKKKAVTYCTLSPYRLNHNSNHKPPIHSRLHNKGKDCNQCKSFNNYNNTHDIGFHSSNIHF